MILHGQLCGKVGRRQDHNRPRTKSAGGFLFPVVCMLLLDEVVSCQKEGARAPYALT